MSASPPPGLFSRLAAALAALYCAISVALGAYAAHVATELAAQRLERAALYLFLHGLAVLHFSRGADDFAHRALLTGLLLGAALFCGSLAAAALLGWPTRAAPWGGGLMIASWLFAGLVMLRRNTPAH
ncbi:MAG: DUF423 domain-containing protein [Lysobacteraceae bacterium]